MLSECRANDVCRDPESAATDPQMRLKLGTIALSPGPRVQSRQQSREFGIHSASNLSNPAFANRFSVLNFARSTRVPSAVMR